MRTRSGDRGGFTLLEVMIALALVGGLLVTLLYTLNYHLGIAERHETVTIATMLGKKKILDVRAKPGNAKGAFPEPHDAYRFSAEVKESKYPGIAEVWVTVKRDREEVIIREFIRSETLGIE
jgi:general secretion pathway protein I